MENLSNQKPKARKEHICDYCNGLINVGEVYDNQTNVYEGKIYSWKSHLSCQELASDLNWFDDFSEGLTESDFSDLVNQSFNDLQIILKQEENDLKKYSYLEKLDFVKTHKSLLISNQKNKQWI